MLGRTVDGLTIGLVAALLVALAGATRLQRGIPRVALLDSTARWHPRVATPARLVFERQLDSLATSLDALSLALDSAAPTRGRAEFRGARRSYKRAEGLLQLYSPTTAHLLNGPVQNDDPDAPPRALGSPAEFQIVLSSLAAPHDTAARHAAREAALSMRDAARQLRAATRYLDIGELPALEAARSEIARVTTLGLAGVDLDDPSRAVDEAADALEGVRAVAGAESMAAGVSRERWAAIDTTIGRAVGYLRLHPSFVRLDRMRFLTEYADPAARAIALARAPLLASAPATRQVWRSSAATVFDAGALDPAAYAPDYAPPGSPALIALGARLFGDTRLSGNGRRSCATCHDPRRAFTDGRARPLLLRSSTAPVRNTPTLLDAAYQPLYFADERALSLEDQIGVVLASPTEMGSSADAAAASLARDADSRSAFARVLAGREDSLLDGRAVRMALAAYVRSLDSFDSRFDRAVRGDSTALSARERRGFTLFMGKARCGSCHFAPLFSGVMPPEFTSSEPEIIGVPARAATSHAVLDPDSGRAGVDHVPEHRFAFKVPTLRNVAVTAPYMHNGAYATLSAVLDFYERGGGAGIGATVRGQTLAPARLRLTSGERGALLAFLRALTDTSRAGGAQRLQPGTVAVR